MASVSVRASGLQSLANRHRGGKNREEGKLLLHTFLLARLLDSSTLDGRRAVAIPEVAPAGGTCKKGLWKGAGAGVRAFFNGWAAFRRRRGIVVWRGRRYGNLRFPFRKG